MRDTTSPTILIFDLETCHDSGELLQIGAFRSDTQALYESPILKTEKARIDALRELENLAAGAQYLKKL